MLQIWNHRKDFFLLSSKSIIFTTVEKFKKELYRLHEIVLKCILLWYLF